MRHVSIACEVWKVDYRTPLHARVCIYVARLCLVACLADPVVMRALPPGFCCCLVCARVCIVDRALAEQTDFVALLRDPCV